MNSREYEISFPDDDPAYAEPTPLALWNAERVS
jgi:hypothetical protein